jgi:NAD(P)-dependent dehydrogenase (short-subunit alcohol dehydrogenase family)
MAEEKRTVLTTGANSGLGLAIAIEAAKRGFRSVGTVRSTGKAKAVTEAAGEAGVDVETVQLDVTDAGRCKAVIGDVAPDILVNNAGYALTGAIEDVSDDEARAILETMVLAPIRLARLSVPIMRERGRGMIMNMSSMLGRSTVPLNGWYCATKYAMESLTDALRMEVGGSGIRVILIEPGVFATNISDDVDRDVAKRKGSHYESAYRRTQESLKRARPMAGDPKRVAQIVVRAMKARAPRSRYLIGSDAQLLTISQQVLPTPVRDFMARRTMGL